MNDTKNDLSHNEAKLDLAAMTTTASIAVGMLRESISRYLGKLGDNPSAYLEALWLKEDAQRLVICSETLATLLGTKTREIITIINKSARI